MFHIPIANTNSSDEALNFSHFNQDANAGQWKKENILVCDYTKINVFVEGKFSAFSGGTLHHAVYGDICLIPEGKMHYGHIPEPTHLNYYQLDVGLHAFRSVPGGEEMINRLLAAASARGSFIRPDAKSRDTVLSLCQQVELYVQRSELALAFAKSIELLSLLYELYSSATFTPCTTFSYHTAKVIKYIEDNYGQNISIEEIANGINVSTSYISRVFKKETGFGIHEYLNQYRVLKATAYLNEYSVAQTSYLCGFCDSSHFIAVFKKHMNATPIQYRQRLRSLPNKAPTP